MPDQLKQAPVPGVQTTEYERAKSSGLWGVAAVVLGGIVAVVPTVTDTLAADSKVAVIAGAVVAVAGIIQKTLADLGYIKSRTDVKVSASLRGGHE